MKTTTYTCDVCSTMRKETNHWFCVSSDDIEQGTVVVVFPWETNTKKLNRDAPGVVHVCGQGCLSTHIGRVVGQ